MSKLDDAMELAATLALNAKPHKHALHKSTDTVRNAISGAKALMRQSAKLQRLAEMQCNDIERWNAAAGRRVAEWTEADEAACERAITKARAAVLAVVADYYTSRALSDDGGNQTAVRFCRDPRGTAVRIAFKSRIVTL